jgi:hypothetical protein
VERKLVLLVLENLEVVPRSLSLKQDHLNRKGRVKMMSRMAQILFSQTLTKEELNKAQEQAQ